MLQFGKAELYQKIAFNYNKRKICNTQITKMCEKMQKSGEVGKGALYYYEANV